MKCAFLLVCLLAAAAMARAQVQEQGLTARLSAKWDMQQVNPMQYKSFSSSSFSTKSYGTPTYGGVKDASIKTYETHSFLGIKNPWLGQKIFATSTSEYADRPASESSRQFKTDSFAVRDYDKSTRKDLVDAQAVVPSAAQPKPFLITPKNPGVVDRFTQNLHKDLTIDDVRDLLNKGKGE